MVSGIEIRFKKYGVKRNPSKEIIIPEMVEKKITVSTISSVSAFLSAPRYWEMTIVAPDERPTRKLTGSLNNADTESIAARPDFPIACPTITASTVVYSCWKRLLASIGSMNTIREVIIFPFVRSITFD